MRVGLLGLIVLVSSGCVRSVSARAENWWTVEGAHVRLRTDVDRTRAADTAWALEDLHGALERSFGECPATAGGERIEVVLLGHDAEYDEIAPTNTAGFFHHGTPTGTFAIPPRIVVRGSRSRGMAQIVAHELTHRFVAGCFPGAPVWLHEGLATYFETIRVRVDDVVVGLAPFRFSDTTYAFRYFADGFDRTEVPRSLTPSPTELVAMNGSAFYETHATDVGRRTARYAAAWALVHMLYLGPDEGLRARFRTYLSRLHDGIDAARAFQESFGDMPLDAAFTSYLDRGTLHERHVPYAPGAIPEPEPTPFPAGLAHLLWAQLYRAHDPVADAAHVEAHLAAAEASPDARARALLFRADYVASTERDALVATAVALAPDDLEVLRAGAVLAALRPPSVETDALVAAMSGRSDLRAVDHVALSTLLLARGDPAAAATEAAAAIALEPSSPAAHLAAADAATAAGDTTTAIVQFGLVITLAAHHDPAIARRAAASLGRVLASRSVPVAASAPQATPEATPPAPPPPAPTE